MHYPQVVVYESDGRLAHQLRELSRRNGWPLREPRLPENCIRLLRTAGPGVLVLKLGRDLLRELTLLERVAWHCPETAVVVVGETEDAVLAGLAWDLGANFVLFPPQPRDHLPAVVEGLMKEATGGETAAAGTSGDGRNG